VPGHEVADALRRLWGGSALSTWNRNQPPWRHSRTTVTLPPGIVGNFQRVSKLGPGAVLGVVAVAAVASYEHAHELTRAHSEAGRTARMVPFTMDSLIYTSSMVAAVTAADMFHHAVYRAWWPGIRQSLWRRRSNVSRPVRADVSTWMPPGPAASEGAIRVLIGAGPQ